MVDALTWHDVLAQGKKNRISSIRLRPLPMSVAQAKSSIRHKKRYSMPFGLPS